MYVGVSDIYVLRIHGSVHMQINACTYECLRVEYIVSNASKPSNVCVDINLLVYRIFTCTHSCQCLYMNNGKYLTPKNT